MKLYKVHRPPVRAEAGLFVYKQEELSWRDGFGCGGRI